MDKYRWVKDGDQDHKKEIAELTISTYEKRKRIEARVFYSIDDYVMTPDGPGKVFSAFKGEDVPIQVKLDVIDKDNSLIQSYLPTVLKRINKMKTSVSDDAQS
jgi:hypothetical protein